MEKISIVRRRLEVAPTQGELRARQRIEERRIAPIEGSTALALLPEPPEGFPASFAPSPMDAPALMAAPSAPVSVDLSPETREELWNATPLDETASGKRHFIVEAEQATQDGRVVLKLEFMKPDYYLRLLTAEEVCEMLHVSKSSLYVYSRKGQLRVYRMGRALRFRFQDVLDFITGCQVGRA